MSFFYSLSQAIAKSETQALNRKSTWMRESYWSCYHVTPTVQQEGDQPTGQSLNYEEVNHNSYADYVSNAFLHAAKSTLKPVGKKKQTVQIKAREIQQAQYQTG